MFYERWPAELTRRGFDFRSGLLVCAVPIRERARESVGQKKSFKFGCWFVGLVHTRLVCLI